MQSLLECGICLENFSTNDKKPVCLPCGHTVCKSCVSQMCKSGNSVTCPFCKKVHKTKVEDLPVNYMIIGAIEQQKENEISEQAAKQIAS